MSIYTEAELIAKIKEIDDDMAASQKVYQYTYNSGRGSQSKTNQQLLYFQKIRESWMRELREVSPKQYGILSAQYNRENL